MPTIDVKNITRSLLYKGFKKEDRDHRFYVYYDGGKRTAIHTKISHSEKEIGGPLIGMMSRQMHLSTDEFRRFVKCTLSKEQYADILRSKGFI